MIEINFETIRELNKRDTRFHFKVQDPKETIIYVWNNLMKDKIEWIPEYDLIADWLGDNKGKGLFLYGGNGRGKSVMIEIIIPAILRAYYRKVVSLVSSKALNERIDDNKLRIDELLKVKLLSIDDVGKESPLVHYGEVRIAFAEIMDSAEKNGNFILASSNLDADELLEKYDNAVLERIKSCCFRVPFDKKEKSLRK